MKKLMILFLSLHASSSFADLYQCRNDLGTMSFQDKPCAPTEKIVSHTGTEDPLNEKAILGGYESCEEMKDQIYGFDDGLDLLKEDMANFAWQYDDLVRALEYCRLPLIPKIYVE